MKFVSIKSVCNATNKPGLTCLLLHVFYKGVPKAKRGEIWVFLSKQHDLHSPPEEEELWRDKTYQEIKEGSTCHQHSIFIDLGEYGEKTLTFMSSSVGICNWRKLLCVLNSI